MINFTNCPLCGSNDWRDTEIPAKIYHIDILYQSSCKKCLSSGNDRFRLFYLDSAHTDIFLVNFCLYDYINHKGFEIKNFITLDYSTIEKYIDPNGKFISQTNCIRWNYSSRSAIYEKLKLLILFS